MSEDGKNGNGSKTIMWIFAVIVFPTLFFIGSGVIANERVRQEADAAICKDVADFKEKQNEVNQQILVSLAEIKADVKYIRREVKE